MSTDFENELRDLFREKAGEAPLATPSLPASAPRQVLRRGRRHQVATVLGSAVVVVALIVGSVAGLTRILGEGKDDQVGNGDYEVFQRTATVEAFTVTSPSDWYLVNQWPLSMLIAVETSGGSSSSCVAVPGNVELECETTPGVETSSPIPVPHGLPMLQLSNVDMGLMTNACDDGLLGNAAVLYVGFDYERALVGALDPSVRPFTPGMDLRSAAEGPCGPGRYAHFTVDGEPFFAWIGTGAAVSAEDLSTVQTAYETMTAAQEWQPRRPDHQTPGYVIAGGTSDPGGAWRLEARAGEDVELALIHAGSTGRIDISLGSGPVTWCCASMTEPDRARDVVIFGAVRKDATGVVFRPDAGRDDIPGMVVPVPPSVGSFGFDLFFIPGTAGLAGRVVPVGIDGSEEPPQVAEPRADEVELAGDAFGQRYRVRFTGAFADDTACIYVTVGGDVGEPLCPRPIETSLAGDQPSLHGWNTDALYLLGGSVPLDVVEIRLIRDDGTVVPSQFRCAMGPSGWIDPDRRVCAIALPSEGSGTLLYFDADGEVVFEEGTGWGAAEPEEPSPNPVNPVHGGTYWAVYPWVGAAGSREADDVSAQLLAEFGIEAFPGDLACDQGATEALGTNAEQGIGVYFETEDEAGAFALQAGLLGHEAPPVIARVTTYCLD